MFAKMDELLRDLHREFGLKSRFYSLLGGRYVLGKIRQEEARLAAGWTYEPPTFYERNYGPEGKDAAGAALCRWVAATTAPAKHPLPAPHDATEPATV
jgi:hypothetical protein